MRLLSHLKFAVVMACCAVLAITLPSLAEGQPGMIRRAVAVGPMQIAGAFAPATRPTASGGGVFLTIRNTGTTDDRLVSASTPVAGATELHDPHGAGDTMQIGTTPAGMLIRAGEMVKFEPGGMHIVLTQLRYPLKQGDSISLTLTFERAGSVELKIPVEGFAPSVEGMPPTAEIPQSTLQLSSAIAHKFFTR